MATDRIGQFQYRRFAPAMPALRPDGHELARHAVLIVGGGPVGLSLALGLARRGIRSVVFEADDAVCEGACEGGECTFVCTGDARCDVDCPDGNCALFCQDRASCECEGCRTECGPDATCS